MAAFCNNLNHYQRKRGFRLTMEHQPQSQEKLFYTRFNLSQRIPKNHILRKISNMVEFDFVYKEVKDKYGYNKQ